VPCISDGCLAAPKLGSFYCAEHSQAGANTLLNRRLPPLIDAASVPKSGERPPQPAEAMVFAQACTMAGRHVSAFIADLEQANSRALRAIEKVFGLDQTEAAKNVFVEMADVLKDWASGPTKALKVDDMKPFLGWLAGTSARKKTWLLFGTYCDYAPISLPPPTARTQPALEAFARTLIHESAHGVSVEINDRAGYRSLSPGTFYRATIPERLVNADHYAACIALHQKWFKLKEWDAALLAHGEVQALVPESRLKGLVSGLSKIVMCAKIQIDRQIPGLKDAQGKHVVGPHYVDLLNALGLVCAQNTPVNAAIVERVVDVAHQLRRFENLLPHVEVGDGEVISVERNQLPDDITEAELKKVGIVLFSSSAGAIKLVIGAAAGREIGDAELRTLLLKALLKHCLQHKQNAADANRRLRAEHVAELYRRYSLPGSPPLALDLTVLQKNGA
jgi:hypothetical protein